MILFAQSEYLILLFLIPLFFLFYGVGRFFRNKKLRKLGDISLINDLMPSYSGAKGWIRVGLFSLAFTFFVIGLARPQIGAKLKEKTKRGAEIILVLDVSNSMMAQDYVPTRLNMAKLAISKMVDKLKDERVGMVIFAGTSFVQLPVTNDYVSAKSFLNTISTESIPIQGTDITGALQTAIKSFSPQSKGNRAIILISDGENNEEDPSETVKQAVAEGIKIFTIGVGTTSGKPLQINGEYLRDSHGNIVVSKLNEDLLKNIAFEANGAYVHAKSNNFGIGDIVNTIKEMEGEEYNSIVFEEYDEQFMYFMAISLCFFVIEMLVGKRKHHKKIF